MSLFERILLLGSTLLVGLSGAIYGAMKYLLRADDPYAVVNHPLEPLFLKIHVLSAPLLVFAVGVVFTRHIWKQWQSRLPEGRKSGIATWFALVTMVLSGYLIQVVTARGWLWWIVAIHLVTGGAYVVGFVVHQLAVPKDRKIASRSGVPNGGPRGHVVPGGSPASARSEATDRSASSTKPMCSSRSIPSP